MSKKLSEDDCERIATVLAVAHDRKAARDLGMSDSEVRSFRTDPKVIRAVAEKRRLLIEASGRMLLKARRRAIKTLIGIMDDKNLRTEPRLEAAKTILAENWTYMDKIELGDRVIELEKMLEANLLQKNA